MGPSNELRQVATELVNGCREGREQQNIDRLYAENAVSVEAYDMMEQGGREMQGRDAIKGKHEWWNNTFEMLDSGKSPEEVVQGPYYFGDDRFGVRFQMKTRNRETGEVHEGTELATYHVDGGKIVREEFFYPM